MKSYEELQERVKELEEAIEWVETAAILDVSVSNWSSLIKELRARAFPEPKKEFKDKIVGTYMCPVCLKPLTRGDYCNHCAIEAAEFTAIIRIPKPRTVTRSTMAFYNTDTGELRFAIDTDDTVWADACITWQEVVR